jgi:hypothetical protein
MRALRHIISRGGYRVAIFKYMDVFNQHDVERMRHAEQG